MDFSTIKIHFIFTGDEDHLADISRQLNVVPTSVRTKEQFKIPEFACYSWQFTVSVLDAKCIEDVSKIVMNEFIDKIDTIQRLSSEYSLRPQIIISVHAEIGDGPELTLTRDFIRFCAGINAEIGFDMYYYTVDEYKAMVEKEEKEKLTGEIVG